MSEALNLRKKSMGRGIGVRKSCIICGGGPSLAKIDYSRFPKDADIFRCNQFFKEEEYYVGRRVDLYMFGGDDSTAPNPYHTLMELARENAYDIDFERFFITNYAPEMLVNNGRFIVGSRGTLLWRHLNAMIKDNREVCPRLARHMEEQYIIFSHAPFAGVAAMALAVFLGYKDIYIAGIDNDYSTGNYPWSKPGEATACDDVSAKWHNRDMQLETIRLIAGLEGISLSCLSEESPMAKIVGMAPVIKENQVFVPVPTSHATREYVPAPGYPYASWGPTGAADVKLDTILNGLAALSAKVEAVSAPKSAPHSAARPGRKYPAWLIGFLCWFVPKRKNRRRLREKYARS